MAAGSHVAVWALLTLRQRSRQVMMTVLGSLVQPRVDYCSQLWSPADQASINRVEAVQQGFVGRLRDTILEDLDFWVKLNQLQFYSQEQQRQRYMICFLWNLSWGLIKGYNIGWQWSDRQGKYAVPAPLVRGAPAAVRQAREHFLSVRGAMLFNQLPAVIRNQTCNFESFKYQLDVFLSAIPDQQTVPGLTRFLYICDR